MNPQNQAPWGEATRGINNIRSYYYLFTFAIVHINSCGSFYAIPNQLSTFILDTDIYTLESNCITLVGSWIIFDGQDHRIAQLGPPSTSSGITANGANIVVENIELDGWATGITATGLNIAIENVFVRGSASLGIAEAVTGISLNSVAGYATVANSKISNLVAGVGSTFPSIVYGIHASNCQELTIIDNSITYLASATSTSSSISSIVYGILVDGATSAVTSRNNIANIAGTNRDATNATLSYTLVSS